MSSFLIVAALAQAATVGGSTTAPVPAATDLTTGPKVGSSTYVDAEAGAGYSSNPFLSVDNGNGEGFGRVSLRAVHTRVSDRTTTVLSAFAQNTSYTSRYGSAQSFDVNGRHDAAVSEKIRVFIDGDVAYDKGGQLDTRILTVQGVPLLPGTIIPPTLLTPGSDFLTVTGRTYRANADAGAQIALSARDSLSLSSGVDHTIFKTGGLDTRYTTVPLSLGYDRQLSEATTVGARVVAQLTHYSATPITPASNITVITPEATGQFKLSRTLTLTGDVGASFSTIHDALQSRHSVGLAGDIALCSSGEHTQLCGRASLQQQAATSAGPTRVASVEVDYSRQFTANDSVQLSLSGNRYANPTVLLAATSFSHATYVRAAADYSRKIGRRLFAGVDLAARKISQTGPDPNADLSVSAFIRYRFGDVQ